jgi:hypothetical protein
MKCKDRGIICLNNDSLYIGSLITDANCKACKKRKGSGNKKNLGEQK